MESIALIIYLKTLGFQQNLCHSETTYNSKHVFKWHFARDQSNSLHLVLWIVYIYMTNGVKRPKAIIKDPKACQADGGSFVYKQSFIGKLKFARHILSFEIRTVIFSVSVHRAPALFGAAWQPCLF